MRNGYNDVFTVRTPRDKTLLFCPVTDNFNGVILAAGNLSVLPGRSFYFFYVPTNKLFDRKSRSGPKTARQFRFLSFSNVIIAEIIFRFSLYRVRWNRRCLFKWLFEKTPQHTEMRFTLLYSVIHAVLRIEFWKRHRNNDGSQQYYTDEGDLWSFNRP